LKKILKAGYLACFGFFMMEEQGNPTKPSDRHFVMSFEVPVRHLVMSTVVQYRHFVMLIDLED